MSALLTTFLAGIALGAVPADTLRVVQVGEVQVVASAGRLDAAIALAEGIDRPTEWPGLGRRSPGATAHTTRPCCTPCASGAAGLAASALVERARASDGRAPEQWMPSVSSAH